MIVMECNCGGSTKSTKTNTIDNEGYTVQVKHLVCISCGKNDHAEQAQKLINAHIQRNADLNKILTFKI